MSRPTATERLRQAARLLRSEGSAGVAQRLLERAANRLPSVGHARVAIDREDLLRVAEIAAAGWPVPEGLPVHPGTALTIAWVCFAPAEGSGGHTTMFRLVSALERAGHNCIVYLREDHGWSIEQHRRTIRRCWPDVKAEIRPLAGGIEDAHAIFATAWPTAYSVLASPAKGARFYLVQDYEPAFHPAGGEAMLAEATFRFGFHLITAGAWLSGRLRKEYDATADHFDFGCDLGAYRWDPAAGAEHMRAEVCYFCRPSTPRRAHELAVMALDLFAVRHPAVDIHLFGESAKNLPFAAIDHGVMAPAALNNLYNRCVAGLVLSATNVSLVPHEMLAAGCIPVVNDAEHNRIVLDNEEVVYAPGTPYGLADGLSGVVLRGPRERTEGSRRAAQSVQSRSWHEAGDKVERIVREVILERAVPEAVAV
jgi:hypothetical protein